MAGKRPKDWRAGIRSFQEESPTKQSLRASGSSAGQPQGRAFGPLRFRLLLVAATCGPGRPGLRRCRKGGLPCLASNRAQGPVGPR